jgi:preprotein translocase subunit SecE
VSRQRPIRRDLVVATVLVLGFCGLLCLLAIVSLLLGWAPSLPRVAGG